MNCNFCGGFYTILGVLGTLAHLRCRDCGLQMSVPADDLEADWTEGDTDE